jgi:hypothetical protein
MICHKIRVNASKEKMIMKTGNFHPVRWSILYPANTANPNEAII